MFGQEKEFFRLYFRLIRVLFFAALLCQSEAHQKASITEIKSCSRAASASMKKENFDEVVTDGKNFLSNLLDCTLETHKLLLIASETEDCKTFDKMIPSLGECDEYKDTRGNQDKIFGCRGSETDPSVDSVFSTHQPQNSLFLLPCKLLE